MGLVLVVGVAVGVLIAEAISIVLPARPQVPGQDGVFERGSTLSWTDAAGPRWRLEVPATRGWHQATATQLTRGLIPVPLPRRVAVPAPILVGPRMPAGAADPWDEEDEEEEIATWQPGLRHTRPAWRPTARTGRLVVLTTARDEAASPSTEDDHILATLRGGDPDELADQALAAVERSLRTRPTVTLVTWTPMPTMTTVTRGAIEEARRALALAVEAPDG